MKKKVYVIGGSPDLVVYGDIEPVFAATEMIPSDDRSIEPGESAVRILFLGGAAANDITVELPSSARTVFESVDVHLAGDGGLLFGRWFGRAKSVVRYDRGLAVIAVPGLRKLNRDFISRRLFRPVLDDLLSGIGYVPLHGAGVTVGNVGCIIAGPAGSGKTSLLSGLIRNGFGFIADDRIMIRKERGSADSQVLMHSFPEYIRLAVNARGPKHLVVPPSSPSVMVGVRYILFLQDGKAGRKVEMLPVGTAEAAARLLHFVSPNTGSGFQRRAFDVIGEIVESASAFRLTGWGDRQRWIGMVSELLRSGKRVC